MTKLYLFVLVSFIVSSLSGCGSEASANETSASTLYFEEFSGTQTEIFHQKLDVINSSDIFSDYLASLPSLTNIPSFDESTETIISILSPSSSCSFSPAVSSVVESSEKISITVRRIYQVSPETCSPLPYATYAYNLIKIEKTSKLIELNFEI
jgi:hypothetical protein